MKNLMNISAQTTLKTILTLLLATTAHTATAETERQSSGINDGLVAVVNDSPILSSELALATEQLNKIYAQKNSETPYHDVVKKQALNQLIMIELQMNVIKKAGLVPKESAINAQLKKYMQAEGVTSVDSLQKKMDSKKKGSYSLLRKAVSNDLAIKALVNAQVNRKVKITPQEVQAFLNSPEGQRINNNKYQTVHIRVSYNIEQQNDTSEQVLTEQAKQKAVNAGKDIQQQLQLTNDNSPKNIANIIANVQKDYPSLIQGGNQGFHKAGSLPPIFASDIINSEINKVNIFVTNNGVDIIKLIDKKIANNSLVPQWRTRHILVSVNELQNDEMAQYKINDLYEQLRRGSDFTELATNYSDDIASAAKGGDLSWVSEGNMVPQFEEKMKQTLTGDFSVPFKTQYGWHILQVDNTRQYDASQDILKGMAREILFQRKAPQAQEDWMQELKSSAYIKVF